MAMKAKAGGDLWKPALLIARQPADKRPVAAPGRTAIKLSNMGIGKFVNPPARQGMDGVKQ